jgi:DNA gyrase subunit A
VRFARPDAGDSIIAITRNDETVVEAQIEEAAEDGGLPADGAGRADATVDGVPSDPDDSGDPAPEEPTGGES